MIRGAIEIADPGRIAGWIFCEGKSLRGQLALAFAGSRCVGAGPIGLLRKDLADAGLGDGHSGFDFEIELRDAEQLPSVVIKLQLSDFALLQRNSEVVSRVRQRPPLQLLATAAE